MALDAELAKIEAVALKARSVRDFLALVELLRGLTDADADQAAALVERIAAARGFGSVLLAATERAAIAATAATTATLGAVTLGAEVETALRRIPRLSAAALDLRVKTAMRQAAALLVTDAPLDALRAPILGAAASVRATLATEVTSTANAYVTSISDEAGVATVWVAETNACVECLAYSGVTAEPGDAFPGGLTYGRRARSAEPVAFPPLHPNCRCFVEPLGSQEYADALRREADRSVLRGFSLESEPMSTRVDAAARLLERGVDAPASVIDFAERAVASGRFATRGRPTSR